MTYLSSNQLKQYQDEGYVSPINVLSIKEAFEARKEIELIEKNLGKKATIDYKPFHRADMMTTWADISRAKKILDWQPSVTLEEGIAQCVDWYKDNYSWIKNISL